jgi:hypothetical protein
MSLGFIILRHVNNRKSDLFWKECYRCIRKFYDNRIMIIDDSSKKEYLNDDIILKNTMVIYDVDHKGAGESLPYYYFHKFKPFDQAVILHDTTFIQSKVDFELAADENIKLLWTFHHNYDDEIFDTIHKVIEPLDKNTELINLYHIKSDWLGCFGVMSNIKWDFLDKINSNHKLFDRLFDNMKDRLHRHAFERVFALLVYYNSPNQVVSMFGSIYDYCPWGITFDDYLNEKNPSLPIAKVWVGR